MMLVKKNTALLLSILVSVFTSCRGQNNTPVAKDALNSHSTAITTGDTVAEISKAIFYIFQDKRNIYWFGSDDEGVYRYDGTTMVHYSTRHGLCNNRTRGIQEDMQGNIYFNTVNGISKFDGKTFTTLHGTNGNLPNGDWRLHPADLWFAGAQDSGVVYRYDGSILHRLKFPKTKAGEAFIAKYPRAEYPQMTFSPYDVYSIYKDSKGNLWFGTNIGVCRYDGKNFDWISEEELGIDDIAFHVRSTYEDKKGGFWFTNTMHRFNIYHAVGKGKSSPVAFEKEKGIVGSKEHGAAYFLSSVEDDNGNLWMATYNKGIWRYDGNNLVQYPVTDGSMQTTTFSVYKDNKGELWIGTHTAGAYKFNGSKFEKFKF